MDTILTNKKNPMKYPYTGTVQPQNDAKDKNGQPLYGYLPDDDLVTAVNLAIYLNRPLLLKGEPGCGKTRLARAVAFELRLPYESWYIKSTSRARDGLYTYDNISRLRDAQLGHPYARYIESIRRPRERLYTYGNVSRPRDAQLAGTKGINDPTKYMHLEALGRAFQNEQQTVVLIDEIDKADIDFPNDLLLELDEQRFVVQETGQEIRAKKPPIVFITSNDEKDLPDAFLRRCIFHYIKFPGEQRLAEILAMHSPDPPQKMVKAAIDRFLVLRKKMYEDKGEAGKKISTSELIDWFRVLRLYPEDDILSILNSELPFADVLLKSWDDHRRYLEHVSAGTLL
jgi:MoxR-like ATPase